MLKTFPFLSRGARVVLLFSQLLAISQAQGELFLGSLSTLQHQVAGDVYLLSEKVIEIRGFTFDGNAPAAYFWADTSATPSVRGEILSDGSPSSGCAVQVGDPDIPAANNVNQRVEFPGDLTIYDFQGGSLSVWCEAFTANFGSLVLPATISVTQVPSNGPALECSDSQNPSNGGTDIPVIALTPEGYNCEPMDEDFQVRWNVNGDAIDIELVGRIEDGNYMAFGVSGANDRTLMIGGDIVVADSLGGGNFRARDYHMTDQAQCDGSNGVCPDAGSGFSDDVSAVSGEQGEGITLIRYTRPLSATDADFADRPISAVAGVQTFIAWALGPIEEGSNNPFFHTLGFARADGQDVSIDFGRVVTDNCSPLIDGGVNVPTAPPPPPFDRPLIGDETTIFDLHIGPSGGPRGYSAITDGLTSWGIAWYVNGFLIPELVIRRGTKYTFRVNGGNDPINTSAYHPLYLTTSEVGGYAQLTPQERLNETPLAGVTITNAGWADNGVQSFTSTASGPICNYETTDATSEAELLTFDEYFSTLDSSCKDDDWLLNQAGILEFTPDAWTPDIIYYHCVTHKNLGFKIRVIDTDAPEATKAPTAAPNAVPNAVPNDEDLAQFTPVGLEGQIAEGIFNFRFNENDVRADGQDTITVVWEVPTNAWAGWAVNDNGGFMPGSEAVIGLPETGEVRKYNMNARSQQGVVLMPDEKQTLIDTSIVQENGRTVLTFTKILVEEGEIPIDLVGDNVFLSAWGLSNRLGFHEAAGSYLLSGESLEVKKINLWKAHGWCAALAWGLFTPLAIATSVLRRFFPNGLWFQIHRGLNTISLLLTIVAVVIAIVAINQETPDGFDAGHFKSEFADGHRLFGLIIFILSLLQGVGGLVRPHLPPQPEEDTEENKVEETAPEVEAKSSSRVGWEIGHKVIGFAILAFSWYQVQLGIKVYAGFFNEDDSGSMLPAFWAVAGTIGAVIIGGYVMKMMSN